MRHLIVDGNSLYARAWYAAQNISTDPERVLSLTANMVLNIVDPMRNLAFNQSLFCWDAGKNESKHRKPRPKEYYEYRLVARDMLELLLGTVNVELDPFEGDDLVASAVYNSDPKADVYVASGDKDLMQLVDNQRVHYYSLNEKCVLTESFICSKFHVKHPSHIAIALAIQGDAVDCIQGVRGWGPTKVKKLFEDVDENATFESVVEAITDKMTPEQHDQFYTALERTLPTMTIPTPAPAPIAFPSEADAEALGMPDVARRVREVAFAYKATPDDIMD